MDHSSMDMDMDSTTTMDHNSSSSSSSSSSTPMMDHSMMSMTMTFTTSWRNTPILFNAWKPATDAQLFGALCAIFFAAMFTRFLALARIWMERRYWNPKGVARQSPGFARDFGRLALTGVTAALAYALMLVAMTYVVGYFFAIIAGLAVAEFLAARLVGGGGFEHSC